MACKLPYLLKNRYSNYYLRFLLPSNSTNGKRCRSEIRLSLKTKDFQEALAVYQLVVPSLKYRIDEFCSMNREQAQSMAESAILKSDLKRILSERIEKVTNAASENKNHWKTRLAVRSFQQSIIDCILEPMTELTLESHSNASIAQELAQTSDALKKDNIRLEDKNHKLIDFCRKALLSRATSAAHSGSTSENRPIHELLELYLDERKPSLAPRTFTQLIKTLERFIEIIGIELHSRDISNPELDRYCKVIKSIAPNYANSNLPNKPNDSNGLIEFWENAATSNTGKTLASNGVEKHFSAVRPFLKWCYERNSISNDYSVYPSLRKTKKASDILKKTPFSKEQLKLIFSSYLYGDNLVPREQPKNYHFWLPLIALTTEMRIAEIVGLEKVDVRKQEDTWVFDLNEAWSSAKRKNSALNKSKKNDSSIRLVPVPQILIEAGFIDYIESLKSDDMIFPELNLGTNKGLGDYASKWFNERYTKYIGLEKRTLDGKQGVSFHSFRHNFVTTLDKTVLNGRTLSDAERCYLTGHENNSVRHKTYNHDGFNLVLLKEHMDAMDYQIDLSSLSFTRFKRRKRKK